MAKVLITTVPFGGKDRLPIELLENAGIEYLINPFNIKITEVIIKIAKKYIKIYTIDVILDNRLKRFTSSNQIQIENKTVKLMNKGKLLKLVYNIFVVFKYLF